MPAEHRAHVLETLAASMPAPVAMYRAGGFSVPRDEIPVPTLYITGANDGCSLPLLPGASNGLATRGRASVRARSVPSTLSAKGKPKTAPGRDLICARGDNAVHGAPVVKGAGPGRSAWAALVRRDSRTAARSNPATTA